MSKHNKRERLASPNEVNAAIHQLAVARVVGMAAPSTDELAAAESLAIGVFGASVGPNHASRIPRAVLEVKERLARQRAEAMLDAQSFERGEQQTAVSIYAGEHATERVVLLEASHHPIGGMVALNAALQAGRAF